MKKYLIKKTRIHRLLTYTMVSVIAVAGVMSVVSGNGLEIETHELRITSDPVFSGVGVETDLNDLVSLSLDSQPVSEMDDVHYVIRDESGEISNNFEVHNDKVVAKEEGVGYLYAYKDNQVTGNAVPIYASRECVSTDEQGTDETAVKNENSPMPGKNTPGKVVLVHDTKEGLGKNYVDDFYTRGTLKGRDLTVLEFHSAETETNEVNAVLNQSDELLPRIWYSHSDGTRALLSESDIQWKTSDPQVISVDSGVPVMVNTGSALLTGTYENYRFRVKVNVEEELTVSNFDSMSAATYDLLMDDDDYYSAGNTYLWPTVEPEADFEDGTVFIKGNRIYQSGSQYYYAPEDFEMNAAEVVGHAADSGMLRMSQGMVFMEGDLLDGIVPGVLYRHLDQFWIYKGDGAETPLSPLEDNTDWIEITKFFEPSYVPGADTGPQSDAPFYFESEYNPYPGTLASNCTYAVWALANEALGVRLPNWGDAGNWYRRAAKSGYATGSTPAPNSIIVWDHHVGYVSAVSDDGSKIYIREGNFSKHYHEGWWPVADSRHGQSVYGYIYLTDETGGAVAVENVMLDSGFSGTEQEFLNMLAEMGMEPGERTEVYDESVEAGNIVDYAFGEMPMGSVIDYVVSLGSEFGNEVTVDGSYIGSSEQDFLDWLSMNGLYAGNRQDIETTDGMDGTVADITTGIYHEGDTVDYSVYYRVEDNTEEPAITEESLPLLEESIAPVEETVETDSTELTSD